MDECRHGLDPATCTICLGRRPERDYRDAYAAGACDGCGAEILWAKTKNGKMMPVDAEPSADGNCYLPGDGTVRVFGARQVEDYTGGDLHHSHFTTCISAGRFRRG